MAGINGYIIHVVTQSVTLGALYIFFTVCSINNNGRPTGSTTTYRKAYAVSKLWVLTDNTRKEVDRLTSGVHLEGPVCGFHIRMGDKKTEVPSQEITSYLQLANSTGVECNTCFIASDYIDGALAAMQGAIGGFYPNCTLQYIREPPMAEDYGYDSSRFYNRLIMRTSP